MTIVRFGSQSRANTVMSQGGARWTPRALAAVALAVAAIGYLAWSPAVLAAAGTPKLVVDRTVIDFGDVSYGRYVTAEFTLTNAGDAVLTINEAPLVKAVKGC